METEGGIIKILINPLAGLFFRDKSGQPLHLYACKYHNNIRMCGYSSYTHSSCIRSTGGFQRCVCTGQTHAPRGLLAESQAPLLEPKNQKSAQLCTPMDPWHRHLYTVHAKKANSPKNSAIFRAKFSSPAKNVYRPPETFAVFQLI